MTGDIRGHTTRRSLLLGGLAAPFLCLGSGLRPARAAVAGFAGVYAAPPPLFAEGRSLPEAVFAPGGASGVYVRLVWSQIAPRPGEWDLRLLDREVGRAVAAGKRVSVSLIAGGYIPAWLSGRGVRTLPFDIGRGGQRRACLPVEIGVPWDPAYEAAFLGAYAAVAARLQALPGGWDALRIVKLTGINQFTEEFRMPARTGQQGDVCGPKDDLSRWLEAGYRPSLVVDAWTRIAAGIAERFPDKLLALDVLERNDIPPVDDAGAFTRDPPTKPRIVAEGMRRFEGRFAVQWNGLTAAGRLAETVLAARRAGSVIGWQSNAFRGLEGAGCNTERRAVRETCDDPRFGAILRRGIETGASYIEVWAPDVVQFRATVGAADAELGRSGR